MFSPKNQETQVLPTAALDQLYWVRRPLSSLCAGASEELHTDDENAPGIWWPSLLYLDYSDFQEFIDGIEDEDEDETFEVKAMISDRMLNNMLHGKQCMVARLLGRPIKEFVECIPYSSEDDAPMQLEAHEATQFLSFTKLPQDLHLPQTKPYAFIAPNQEGQSVIVDDELYMSYMLALDIAATTRMSGKKAPKKELRSDFRNKGQAELAKLPCTVRKLSDTTNATAPSLSTEGVAQQQQDAIDINGKLKEDSDDSESEDEEEMESKVLSKSPEKATNNESLPSVSSPHTKRNEAEVQEGTDADTAPTDESPPNADCANNEGEAESYDENREVEDDEAVMKDATSSSATVVSESSEQKEPLGEDAKSTSIGSPLMKNSLTQSPPSSAKWGAGRKQASEATRKPASPMTTDKGTKATSDEACLQLMSPPLTASKRILTEIPQKRIGRPPGHLSRKGSFDMADPGIDSNDSFDEVLEKLISVDWHVDNFSDYYLSPSVVFNDIKNNQQWRNKKFWLSKGPFLDFLKAEYGWHEAKKQSPNKKKTPPKRKTTGTKAKMTMSPPTGNTVTPTPSYRPKRTRRSPSFCDDGVDYTPKMKRKQFHFETTDEEEFYHFSNLIKYLQNDCGWRYVKAKLRAWQYVLPERMTESQGGKHLVDFFYEESEVVQYCVDNDYYANRQKVGLEDK